MPVLRSTTLFDVLRTAFFLGLAVCSCPLSPLGAKAQTAAIAPTSAGTSPNFNSPAPITNQNNPITDARVLLQKSDFDGAIEKYHQILLTKPKSPDAYAGLVRVYLKQKDVQKAYETATDALHLVDSVPLHVALGEVYFRQGKIREAEEEWIRVINSGRQEARAYFGMARVRWAISMRKSALTLLQKAHDIDPGDQEIRELWLHRLSHAEQITFLEGYLAGENNEDPESRKSLQDYVDYLKADGEGQPRECQLVSSATSTDTYLVRLLEDPQEVRAYALNVEVNGHKSKLLMDTGASGIVINRNLARKAGVTPLSNIEIGGIGDKGVINGYRAFANSIKVAGMEFRNCIVDVLDKRSVLEDDGLIGADVFSDFLVDLDFPEEKLRLKKLPQRPGESAAIARLQTEKAADCEPERPDLQDRYIAPEMKNYTRIFRFAHMLLIPTSIGKVHSKLFLLDTGAFDNDITPAAAREVTKVRNSDDIIRGLSGSVNKVYSADKAVLQFGHLKNENQDLTAFDMTDLSESVGTEISGTLGFQLLSRLEIKIDYRDGLVDFEYDPKRWRQ